MIRVLHFADLHLGVESYGSLDPATGLSSRITDFLNAFDQVVEYALEKEVDLVLFCGDAYRSREPSPTHQREFARRIARLASKGILVFLLVGNHDLPHALGRASAVEIFDTLAIRNVIVADKPATHRIQTREGLLQVVALPWVRRSIPLSREETKNLTFDQVNEQIQETLTRWLLEQARSLDPDLPALLAAHIRLSTARQGSEKAMMVGREHILLQSNVASAPFDYVALGHIHSRQVLSQRPPIVYSGSLQAIDFSEEGEEKGFYFVEIERARPQGERAVSWDFHPVKGRRFLTLRVKVSSSDPTQTVLQAIARADVRDTIVRLQIQLPASLQGHLQEGEVRKALREAHFIAAITREVEEERRLRLGGPSAEGLGPLEALRLYLESKSTTPERAKKLLERGGRLINRALEGGQDALFDLLRRGQGDRGQQGPP